MKYSWWLEVIRSWLSIQGLGYNILCQHLDRVGITCWLHHIQNHICESWLLYHHDRMFTHMTKKLFQQSPKIPINWEKFKNKYQKKMAVMHDWTSSRNGTVSPLQHQRPDHIPGNYPQLAKHSHLTASLDGLPWILVHSKKWIWGEMQKITAAERGGPEINQWLRTWW